ncbi:MAG: hypothetical protein QF755_06370 [Candidatus Peribacteraceae bacterium]|jgi:hypothetical protein|nr:hypothetical protein [Candidatus Peribacteraceae bacterium]HCI04147.1 hypothetical protein [Candidatus Peribacteria bacterium]
MQSNIHTTDYADKTLITQMLVERVASGFFAYLHNQRNQEICVICGLFFLEEFAFSCKLPSSAR